MLVVSLGLVAGGLVVGSRLVGLVGGALKDATGRGRHRLLDCIDVVLAGLFTLSAIVVTRTGGWSAPVVLDSRVVWIAGHVMAVSVWLGALLPTVLFLRGAASKAGDTSRALSRAVRRVWWFALFGLAIVGATGVAASQSVDGLPALIGTRFGSLLLLQAVLFTTALALMVASVRTLRLLEITESNSATRRLGRLLTIEVAVASIMIIVAVMLTRLAAGPAEPTVWPFPFRLAPGVMLRFSSVQDQVITGTGIVVVGLLAVIVGYRVRAWRPLLLAAAVFFLVTGLYKTLAAMTIDAYPTTYARPAVGTTASSIGRGRDLFVVHCAPCHGPTGRGDGPAGAGLLQFPADLTAAHTADHTPGDLFWWITHGLGLSMPAFGDQLSVTARWDLVNFVRTLTQVRGPLPTSSTPARAETLPRS